MTFFCLITGMSKSNSKDKAAQGAAEVNEEVVREWLKKDLAVAISCLQAIRTDPDLMDVMASFMFGRYENDRNRKENGQVVK